MKHTLALVLMVFGNLSVSTFAADKDIVYLCTPTNFTRVWADGASKTYTDDTFAFIVSKEEISFSSSSYIATQMVAYTGIDSITRDPGVDDLRDATYLNIKDSVWLNFYIFLEEKTTLRFTNFFFFESNPNGKGKDGEKMGPALEYIIASCVR